jgi:hypothetical protein
MINLFIRNLSASSDYKGLRGYRIVMALKSKDSNIKLLSLYFKCYTLYHFFFLSFPCQWVRTPSQFETYISLIKEFRSLNYFNYKEGHLTTIATLFIIRLSLISMIDHLYQSVVESLPLDFFFLLQPAYRNSLYVIGFYLAVFCFETSFFTFLLSLINVSLLKS